MWPCSVTSHSPLLRFHTRSCGSGRGVRGAEEKGWGAQPPGTRGAHAPTRQSSQPPACCPRACAPARRPAAAWRRRGLRATTRALAPWRASVSLMLARRAEARTPRRPVAGSRRAQTPGTRTRAGDPCCRRRNHQMQPRPRRVSGHSGDTPLPSPHRCSNTSETCGGSTFDHRRFRSASKTDRTLERASVVDDAASTKHSRLPPVNASEARTALCA